MDVECVFSSAFDGNGALHHIATADGTQQYTNPHEAEHVVTTMFSSYGSSYLSPSLFVQHQHAGPAQNCTANLPSSWMAVDLGENRSLCVNHYCLRTGQARHNLRHWQLQGSADGSTWETLREHTNDFTLSEVPMSTAAWEVEAGGRAFRHFRILQTGPNSAGTQQLRCAGIELYGTLAGGQGMRGPLSLLGLHGAGADHGTRAVCDRAHWGLFLPPRAAGVRHLTARWPTITITARLPLPP